MGLSDGRKSFPIGLAVLIQYRSVTATQPPSHVAVAITLNAKASSLKTYKPGLRTYSQRALYDLPKLCMVIELVVPILKGYNHFSI